MLASSAAAQVRPVPTEAGASPLAVRVPAAPAASLGSVLLAPSAAFSLGAAPAAAAFSAPAAAQALPASAPAAPSAAVPAPARPRPLAAAPAPLAGPAAKAARVFPAAGARTPRGAALDRAFETFASAAPPADLDARFDGRLSRAELPAAADGPERAPQAPRPALASSRLRRALRFAGVAVPAAVLVGVAGAVAPHAASVGVHWLGQAAYWLANPFAFMFTVPQIHRMLSRRSGDVSAGMIAVGLAATAAATMNFAFDGKDLMMYRNLAQMLGFTALLGLQWRYARAPGQTPPSKRRALVETGAAALAVVGLMFAAGPALLTAIPGVAAMGALLVPLQVASGFGFTYLMYAQLSKMRRAHSSGDSSRAMMWAYLGTKTIWVWSLATMVSLATAPAWLTLPAAAGFAAVCWLAGRAALSRLVKAPWSFLPDHLSITGRTLTHDRLVDIAAFVALSALILALSAAGYFAFVDLLGVPAAAASRFAMYLLYMVQSLVACLATLKTLRLQKRFDFEKARRP
jgi:hypothetical protein